MPMKAERFWVEVVCTVVSSRTTADLTVPFDSTSTVVNVVNTSFRN
jgi:hypothetical protein